MVSAVWAVNLLILNRLPQLSNSRRIVFSNLLALVTVLFFMGTKKYFFQEIPFIEEEYIYPFVMVLSLNAIVLIIIHSILMREKKERADLEIARLKLANMEARQSLLMQQFQPHFLFNALSTLKSFIRETPRQTENYLLKLSDFLRFTLKANQNLVMTLEEELKFASEYLEMQQIRFEETIFYHIELPSNIMQQQIPVFALQSLVENAIKHNHFTEENPLQIHITFIDKVLVVSNNKSPKIRLEKSGTGLQTLNQRFELLDGQPLQIEESDTQFTVKMHLLPNKQTPN